MGGFAINEIPLLLMLFYLFYEVASSHPHGCLVLVLKFSFWKMSYVEDIVRWGVWLGRHIC